MLATSSTVASATCSRAPPMQAPCMGARPHGSHAWQRRAACCDRARCYAYPEGSPSSSSSSSSPSIGMMDRERLKELDFSALAVNVKLPTRKPPSAPRPVPVIHSSAYMQKEQSVHLSYANSDTEDVPPSMSRRTPLTPDASSYDGNLLEWTLQRVDRSLDEIEHQPLPLQQELYDLSRGPVGQATGKGLATAAELTMKAGVQAAKVVAPVGKWALVNGTKAAVSLVQLALVESAKAKERAKEKERKEKRGGK